MSDISKFNSFFIFITTQLFDHHTFFLLKWF